MALINSSTLASIAHVAPSAITKAKRSGNIVPDDQGYFDTNDPSVALYIQRGIQRNEQRACSGYTPKYLEKKEKVKLHIREKNEAPEKTNEQIFVSVVFDILKKEFDSPEKAKEIMNKIFKKYKGEIV